MVLFGIKSHSLQLVWNSFIPLPSLVLNTFLSQKKCLLISDAWFVKLYCARLFFFLLIILISENIEQKITYSLSTKQTILIVNMIALKCQKHIKWKILFYRLRLTKGNDKKGLQRIGTFVIYPVDPGFCRM